MQKLQPPWNYSPLSLPTTTLWDPVKPLLFETLVEGSNLTPLTPAEKEEGCTLWSLFELTDDDTIDMSTII